MSTTAFSKCIIHVCICVRNTEKCYTFYGFLLGVVKPMLKIHVSDCTYLIETCLCIQLEYGLACGLNLEIFQLCKGDTRYYFVGI